ncbi:DUF4861 family protein [Neolewinella lacunae]|uniref:DUF4861 family protein n=1 Tax=Neolewinella lacunae TaxID=1517758 RepID=A0A923PQ12_9BACT|nr:DUF4861 family protein [Neolewinella lacunae]MBC6994627.1 DUF4861 family protein [Neolewinella lacunae]MDN3634499.1 DUF4861 family protein [Neolewinella lacunae]
MPNLARFTLLCTCVSALLLCPACQNPTPPADAPEMRTNVRLAKRNAANEFVEDSVFTRAEDHIEQILPAIYQNEGPAWENENIGFRMYFDRRNGLDIHGKKVRDMVLDTVGLDRNNYHAMADWGMDVLKVGNSLGAGGIALLVGDSIYRLGDVAKETVRITEESPERSSFRVDYQGWEVAGRTLDLTWAFSIAAGTHHYESAVTATGLRGDEQLVIGIVNLHSDTLYTLEQDGRFVMYTHGPQAELEHYLGMALSLERGDYLRHGALGPEEQPVSSTYYVVARLREGLPTGYRFTAGWAPGHPAFIERAAFQEVIR